MEPHLITLVDALRQAATPEEHTGRLRLPPERELGARLAMSRATLREQLSSLEMLGFLHRTQGRGTYLEVPDANFMRLYFSLAMRLGHISGPQFERARELLELSVAAEAATLASPEDVRALRADVDAMVESSLAGRVEAATDADFTFHHRLFRIVDNPMFDFLHDGIGYVLRDELTARRAAALAAERRAGRDGWETDHVHYEVVDAIEAGDPRAAREAMARHFTLWRDLTARSTPAPTNHSSTGHPAGPVDQPAAGG
ncbi:FadR family transcriptional regulator [Actinoalloteichus sp. AHMU CJ021]|uniref:FadR/GntR family transcriptional regulator n=1 Tax=Actinoalloteichus sp. AHMU CJ021 TaxID=2072503 RepID=UPI000CA088A5|nr:FadR family transcriptional regulator [Actinoalloteichus sp. AHMU CJ021]